MDFSIIFRMPPMLDWLSLFLLALFIFLVILISEIIRKKLNWSQEITRKIVHVSVGIPMLLTLILLETAFPLILISTFFTIFNYIAVRKNLFPAMHIDRYNLGTVYYPLSFLILVIIFWSISKIFIFAAVMVMAFGDGAAAIAGRCVNNPHQYKLIHDQKSLEGTLVMFLVSTICIFLTFIFYPSLISIWSHGLAKLLLFAVLTAIISTAAEALGHRGNDNLLVPLTTSIVLFYLLHATNDQVFQFVLGMILGAVVSVVSIKFNFLSPSGSVATFILASIIFGFGGWSWAIPILAFFILSSLLSKMGKSRKARYDLIFEKGSKRDYGQVFANGGIAVLLMVSSLFLNDPRIYLLYLGALAAAMADTWSTEIGILFGKTPRHILKWTKVPAGSSGGVTFYGFLGGFLGAIILAFIGSIFFHDSLKENSITFIFLITIAGFYSSIVDSLLGATVQVQYKCLNCNMITEKKFHCPNNQGITHRGFEWISNDMVNFINTIFGALTVYVGILLI